MRDEAGGASEFLLGCATCTCDQTTYSCNKNGQSNDKDIGKDYLNF